MPLLDSAGPAIAYGPSGTQCPIPNCSGDGSKRHAFECNLPAIFREEIHGQEITIRRMGALSMIASWRPHHSLFVSELFSSYGCGYYI